MKLRISEKAQRLLSHLRATAIPLSPTTIATKLEMREESVRSLIESLLQRRFIRRSEAKESRFYRLTPEGQRVAAKGLPEIRLVKFLKRQGSECQATELEKSSQLTSAERQLGLGWARRNGWVTVSKRNEQTWLALTPKAEEKATNSVLQKVLNAADERGEIREDQTEIGAKEWKTIRQDLIKRSLAEVVTQKVVTVTITPKGSQALEESLAQRELIGDLTPTIIKSEIWREKGFQAYNLRAPTSPLYPGKKHPYIEFIERVTRILLGFGFQEAKGPLVELEFWNCDALFMPQDHVAREVHDIYHIKTPKGPGKIDSLTLLKRVAQTHQDGWKTGSTGWGYTYSEDIARQLVLRSQTTSVSVRYLAEHKKAPLRMFSIDRNFRPEKFDTTHSAEFLQCEGIIGGEGLTLRDLMGYLRAIAEGVGVKKIKFKPGFFPFTEPSVEGFIHVPELGWMEALPGGIFRPEVTLPLGIDFPVLAWGIGLDRLAMAALGIKDIRELTTRNLGWLRRASLRF